MRTWVQRPAPGVVRGRGLRGGARSEARGAPARSLTSGSVPLLFPCSSRPRAALVGLRRACGLLAFVCRRCRCRFEWIHTALLLINRFGEDFREGDFLCVRLAHLNTCTCALSRVACYFSAGGEQGNRQGDFPFLPSPSPSPQTPRQTPSKSKSRA